MVWVEITTALTYCNRMVKVSEGWWSSLKVSGIDSQLNTANKQQTTHYIHTLSIALFPLLCPNNSYGCKRDLSLEAKHTVCFLKALC